MRGKVRPFAGFAILTLATAQPKTQVPLFEPDPLWSQALPNKWVTGQVGGVAVDSHDNVWVFHRPATIPDGEKAASLNPPQAECCIPAPLCWNSIRTESFFKPGAAGQGYEWFTSDTASSSTTKITSGSAVPKRQPHPEVHLPGKLCCRSAMPERIAAATTPRSWRTSGLFVYPKTMTLRGRWR
jgi:hypothetical protein